MFASVLSSLSEGRREMGARGGEGEGERGGVWLGWRARDEAGGRGMMGNGTAD